MPDVPIIILAGQSNAGIGGIDNTIVQALMRRGGAFEFLNSYLGGSTIYPGNGLDWSTSSSGELFDQMIAQARAAADHVRAQGHNPVFTLLWVQGESDIYYSSQAYVTALTALIAAFRSALNAPDAEVHISTLANPSTVRTAQFEVGANVENVHLIDMAGATYMDGVHYDLASRRRMGEAFLDGADIDLTVIPGYQTLRQGLTEEQVTGYFRVRGAAYLDMTYTGDNRGYDLRSSTGDDVITLGNGHNIVSTLEGDDFVRTGNYHDLIDLGQDDDTAYAGGHNDTIYGGNGYDVLYGEAGNDTLFGGAHDDFLFGGDGDDSLTGGTDRDVIDGGDGWDTAIVAGDRAQYRLFLTLDGYLLKGPDGHDQLLNVEVLRFGDGSTFDLTRMYGLGWIDMGGSGREVLPGVIDDGFLLDGKAGAESGPQVLPGAAEPDAGFAALALTLADTCGLEALFLETADAPVNAPGHDPAAIDLDNHHHLRNPDLWAA